MHTSVRMESSMGMGMGMGWLFVVCWHLLVFHFSFSLSLLCHPHDTFALLQFKTSFTVKTTVYDDPYYSDFSFYCHHIDKTATWENGTDCCSWVGVTCHPISGHVIALDLSCSGLMGQIHPNSSLFSLHHLQSLNLAFNYFFYSQLSSLFGAFVRLTSLNLSNSDFGGEIPPQISHLSKLQSLDLSRNYRLKWKESSWRRLLQNATVLRELVLDGTNMLSISMRPLNMSSSLVTLSLINTGVTGKLTNDSPCLPHLQELYLGENYLEEQQLPNLSCSAASLRILDLSWNRLQGPIPASFSNLTLLTSLDLSGNNLNGSIPASFSNLTLLTQLCLSSNIFTSPVKFPLFSDVSYNFSHLRILHLSSVGLTEFPKLSGKVPMLQELDLSSNKLNGTVPKWLHEMDSLQFLNLSQNLLTTPMDQFSRNYKLLVLDLSFNSLTGGISSLICNASSIEILNLSRNKLTGIIPQCLVNLSYLRVMDLQMNKLYGSLPNSFSNNSLLMNLNLNDNQLQGLLPRSLSNCTQLQVLNLANNQIEDTFPNWLQTLPNLKVLVLRANKLHGLIESSKSKLGFPSLVIFDISSNNFNGPIPKAYIQNFEALKNIVQDEVAYSSSQQYMKAIDLNIDLSRNKFEGEIPNVIGELHALRGLNVSHNRLSGPIPQAMENLTNLESLDLSSNMLIGRIPEELVNLNYLEVLNLSYNRLVGEIPQGKQFNTFSNDSYEGNFGLCGVPLAIKCNKDPEQHSQPSENLWREERFGFGWKPVAIGNGCGMVFGVGLGCCVLLIGKPQWLVRMVGGQLNKNVKRSTRMRTHRNRH